jgi:hypothetical protein
MRKERSGADSTVAFERVSQRACIIHDVLMMSLVPECDCVSLHSLAASVCFYRCCDRSCCAGAAADWFTLPRPLCYALPSVGCGTHG